MSAIAASIIFAIQLHRSNAHDTLDNFITVGLFVWAIMMTMLVAIGIAK